MHRISIDKIERLDIVCGAEESNQSHSDLDYVGEHLDHLGDLGHDSDRDHRGHLDSNGDPGHAPDQGQHGHLDQIGDLDHDNDQGHHGHMDRIGDLGGDAVEAIMAI